MTTGSDVLDLMAGLALFADLSSPQLEAVAHTCDEEWFGEDDVVLRQGLRGSDFYIILEGEAAVTIDGEERARLTRGDFFGEVSALLAEPPTANVVALGPLRVLSIPAPRLEEFLLGNPTVLLRMFQAEARRLRNAIRWRS